MLRKYDLRLYVNHIAFEEIREEMDAIKDVLISKDEFQELLWNFAGKKTAVCITNYYLY